MRVRRILVALDGSRLAEAVLPAARSLAQHLPATLLLVHVLEREPPEDVHGQPHLGDARAATEYLEHHAFELRRQRIDVEAHVHERAVGDVAAALDRHAHELDADLIAMCAHGRTNFRDRAMGTIAEQILRGGSIPILLRTVRRVQETTFDLRHVLVPLDFGHDVETALAAARTFARPYGATIDLLTAVEPQPAATRRLLPSSSALAQQYDRADATRRLDELSGLLEAEEFSVRTLVDEREPPDAIASVSNSLPADLIVLITDAHGGLASWYDPSTGQRLLAMPDLTLLLIKEL
jgi:nucleotide-binding universal stress UspA family protein